MQTRGEGVKISEILWTSLLDAPYYLGVAADFKTATPSPMRNSDIISSIT